MKKTRRLHVIATIGFMALGALSLASNCRTQPSPVAAGVASEGIGDFWWRSSAGLVTITSFLGTATSVEIPSEMEEMPVTRIGARSFAARRLTNVTMPSGVTHVEEYAFAFNRLTGVVIPASVLQIGDNAFANNQLTRVVIPNSVVHVGNGAFANNPRVTEIIVGDGIGLLYEGAFENSLRHARISIGANVELHSSRPSSLVWTGFRAAYEANGHRAGIYTLNPNTGLWGWQPR